MNIQEQMHMFAVKLKGIPPQTTIADVIEFFGGVGVEVEKPAVQIVDRDGRATGEVQAFVFFSTSHDEERACERDGDTFAPKFGRHYVRVLSSNEFNDEDRRRSNSLLRLPKTSNKSDSTHSPSVKSAVRVDGLPFTITVQEVLQLFWRSSASLGTTVIQRERKDNTTSVYIDLGTEKTVDFVISRWHGTVMTTQAGKTSLSLRKITRHEWQVQKAMQHAAWDQKLIVKMHGLPLNTTESDIIAYFHGLQVKAGGIHVQPHLDHANKTKIAYVEFSTEEDAAIALEQQQNGDGSNDGIVPSLSELVPRSEMISTIVKFASIQAASNHAAATTTTMAKSAPDAATATATATATTSTQMNHTYSAGGVYSNYSAAQFFPLPENQFFLPGGMTMMMMPPPLSPHQWPPQPVLSVPQHHFTAAMHPHPHPVSHCAQYTEGAAPSSGTHPSSMQQQQRQHPSLSSVTARYMVQDLATGQKVYLDPSFNLAPPVCSGRCTDGTEHTATTENITVDDRAVQDGSGDAERMPPPPCFHLYPPGPHHSIPYYSHPCYPQYEYPLAIPGPFPVFGNAMNFGVMSPCDKSNGSDNNNNNDDGSNAVPATSSSMPATNNNVQDDDGVGDNIENIARLSSTSHRPDDRDTTVPVNGSDADEAGIDKKKGGGGVFDVNGGGRQRRQQKGTMKKSARYSSRDYKRVSEERVLNEENRPYKHKHV